MPLLNQEILGFSLKVILNCVAGAFLLWFMEADTLDEKFSFGRVASTISNELVKAVVQGLLFVSIGAYVALLLAHPSTSNQAFAAGIGWTAGFNGLTGRVRRASNKRSKKEMGGEKKERAKSTTTGNL